MRLLVIVHFFADVLEAGQRIDAADAEMLRDALLQIGRDEGLDDDRVLLVARR